MLSKILHTHLSLNCYFLQCFQFWFLCSLIILNFGKYVVSNVPYFNSNNVHNVRFFNEFMYIIYNRATDFVKNKNS